MDIILETLKPFFDDRREDDAFDRLNYKTTPLLLILCAAVNTAKLYIGGVIECFTKAEFINGWIEYTRDYCFVENTYYLHEHESDDVHHDIRKERYISYYQWVPFILGLQALSLIMPHMIFRSFNWITGFHIYTVVNTAAKNRMEDDTKRTAAIDAIGSVLFRASQNHHQWFQFNGQRFVTYMYFGMKFFYLILICLHMVVFKIFIGNLTFAIDVLNSGIEWRSSGLFPRVTVCDMQILRFGAPLNYTMECVLPLNMFNEKIFVFFYFWMIILFGLNVWSIWSWVQRINGKKVFFRELLASFNKDQENWRVGAGNTTAKIPEATPVSDDYQAEAEIENSERVLIPSQADDNGITKENVDYGWDMCLVLALLREHVGILFTSAIFKKVNLMREKEAAEKRKKEKVNGETKVNMSNSE
jgi:hypothetical protein